MAKEYRIHIRGKQREQIDADLMTGLVIMLGRQLAEEAKVRGVGETQPGTRDEAEPDRKPGEAS